MSKIRTNWCGLAAGTAADGRSETRPPVSGRSGAAAGKTRAGLGTGECRRQDHGFLRRPTKTTTADALGRWLVASTMPASAESRTLSVTEDGAPPVEVKDLLVGEVWLGSGQSNMQWDVPDPPGGSGDCHCRPGAPAPPVRCAARGEPSRQETVNAKWTPATPETARGFSAVGYFFGKQLAEELKIPSASSTARGEVRASSRGGRKKASRASRNRRIPGNTGWRRAPVSRI